MLNTILTILVIVAFGLFVFVIVRPIFKEYDKMIDELTNKKGR